MVPTENLKNIPPVGLAGSLRSEGQETGCRVHPGAETEAAQPWELSAQTLLHISAEWCNGGSVG